jgi:starch-binding outer membrane protein, SusD/RagB family
MRKSLIYITVCASFLLLGACSNFLDLEPLDRVSKDYLFQTPAGVKTLLATLYNKMPMEDFTYHPVYGFNQHPGGGSTGDCGQTLASNTDEAANYGTSSYTSQPGVNIVGFWDYTTVRWINQFLVNISDLKAKGSIDDATYKQLFGEAHFLRAYMYFAMARRYGGLPILDKAQDLPNAISEVLVPRSTEKATWDFVISEIDLAIANLPDTRPGDGVNRVTKWVALALKSRAALHAASVAKFWNKAPLLGAAADAKLVGGMTTADANDYYKKCIDASKLIMDNTSFALYKPNPANKDEAAKNYQDLFESPSYSNPEVIYQKSYIDGSSNSGQGHVTDFWFYPKQLVFHTLYVSSRWSTTLDMVDVFEDYADNGVGASAPIKTVTTGNENYIVANAGQLTKASISGYSFISYDNQLDPFKNKDARLTASVLLPGSTFKSVPINMQGGMIKSDGTPIIYTDGVATGLDGKTYYSYGSNNISGYSGFAALGTAQGNYSQTGFALRKFLQDSKNVTSLGMYGSTQSWIDMRLAEVYLNYAEAVAESGQGDATLAATSLNAIRKRAAHTDNIPLTVDNVLKERRVELIFEDFRYWDLIRRRDFHTRFNATRRFALVPLLDLRQNPPKYVFLRAHCYYDNAANGMTFTQRRYYLDIPGVSTNLLIQNPEY